MDLLTEKERRATAVLNELERKKKIVKRYLRRKSDFLKEEKKMRDDIAFLEGPDAPRILYAELIQLKKNLRELTEVINLLGLRE